MATATDRPHMGQTTISIPEELADELYARKGRGESYADVIEGLLERVEESSAVDGQTAVEQTRPAEPANTRRDDDDGEPEAAADPDTLEEVLEMIDVPGSGEKEQERREAVRAAIDYLQEKGGAEPSDLKADVYPDYPARYIDGKDPATSWWKNCVYKAFDQIAEIDDRLKRADQSGQWRYTDGENE